MAYDSVSHGDNSTVPLVHSLAWLWKAVLTLSVYHCISSSWYHMYVVTFPAFYSSISLYVNILN